MSRVKIYVEDHPTVGPVVTDLKGIRGGYEWLFKQAQQNLCYHPSGGLTVDWQATDVPASLVKQVIICQRIGE